MQLRVYPDYASLSRHTADLIASYVRQKPKSLICLASGHSPLGVFQCLVEDVKIGSLDLSQCEFVGLDEWMGMNGQDNGSCRLMVDEALFLPLNWPVAQIHFFDGRAQDPQHEVDRINLLIEKNGGLDVMLVGIGTNGHIAMNEPGTSFSAKGHISQLAEETIRVGQKYFQTNTALDKGITLGLGHFFESHLPILIASGAAKRAIMNRVLHEHVSEAIPASIVRTMPHAMVMLDSAANP